MWPANALVRWYEAGWGSSLAVEHAGRSLMCNEYIIVSLRNCQPAARSGRLREKGRCVQSRTATWTGDFLNDSESNLPPLFPRVGAVRASHNRRRAGNSGRSRSIAEVDGRTQRCVQACARTQGCQSDPRPRLLGQERRHRSRANVAVRERRFLGVDRTHHLRPTRGNKKSSPTPKAVSPTARR